MISILFFSAAGVTAVLCLFATDDLAVLYELSVSSVFFFGLGLVAFVVEGLKVSRPPVSVVAGLQDGVPVSAHEPPLVTVPVTHAGGAGGPVFEPFPRRVP